jgi:hypothetical protein
VKRCSPDGSTAIGRARVGRRQNPATCFKWRGFYFPGIARGFLGSTGRWPVRLNFERFPMLISLQITDAISPAIRARMAEARLHPRLPRSRRWTKAGNLG